MEISLAPYAPALVESIRSLGYSLESAVADLIDNSITAGAATVKIRFSPYGDPYLAILDDGRGMGPDELTTAMRHGSRNPSEPRSADDLGRFGLGLKTASLSQCRRLTVVSRRDGILSARCWDIDLIYEREDWILLGLEPEEIRCLPLVIELEEQGTGTLVIWQNLDRLGIGEVSIEMALGEKLDRACDHLALVFHRFLNGEAGRRLKILINGQPIEPVDPFLRSHKATLQLHEENVVIEGHTVTIRPYILPHISKLSAADLECAGGEVGLRTQQGFYIYRNYRLILWGTWFRLVRQEELTKLARVLVDIPNALDHLWTLDIKKSMAYPPEVVRQNLRRIVGRIADGSRRVYRFRGRKVKCDDLIPFWDRVQGRGGGISYLINRKHPLISAMLTRLDNDREGKGILGLLLDALEVTYPADALYEDMASDRKTVVVDESIQERLKDLAALLIDASEMIEGGREKLMQDLPILEPFNLYPEITAEILRGFYPCPA
jgi:hypothetical protein